jgi:hypothetical protein
MAMTRAKGRVLAGFAAEFNRCWLCGVTAEQSWLKRLEIHHIVRGPSRGKALDERCALIRACHDCHFRRLDSMPVVMQLAIKKRYDLTCYDRVKVNVLRGRAKEAITEAEVDVKMAALNTRSLENAGFPWEKWRW